MRPNQFTTDEIIVAVRQALEETGHAFFPRKGYFPIHNVVPVDDQVFYMSIDFHSVLKNQGFQVAIGGKVLSSEESLQLLTFYECYISARH